jgi:hypothetical protein
MKTNLKRTLLLATLFLFTGSLGCSQINKTSQIFSQNETADILAAASTVLASGNITSPPGDQNPSGSYRLIQLVSNEARYIALSSDFIVKAAPDLHLLLSPQSTSSANNTNATESAVDLGLLQSFQGEQVFPVSSSVTLNAYQSVLIHCVQYSHLFGGGVLNAAP